MNWISITFFSLAFFIWCTMLKRGADIISPARVFGFTWSIVFGLAELKLSKLQFEWTFTDWVFVLMGPISFLVGIFIVYILNMGNKLLSIDEIRQKVREQKVNETKLFYLILLVFITYIIGYITIFLIKGQIPIFSFSPSAARTEFSSFGVGLFIHNMPVVVFFSLIYHLLVHNNRGKKMILKIVGFSTAITYLFLLQRYSLMMMAIMSFVLLYYSSRYIRFRTMIIFISIGILVFYSVAILRAGKIIQLVLYKSSQMKFSYEYAIFTEPYMYVVMNVENFVHAVSKLEQHTYGYFTFNYVLSLTGIKHWVEEYFTIIETPFLFSGYNTYTLFWTFYRDFGVFGLTFIPVTLGVFVGSIYYSLRRNPTIKIVSSYCVIVFVMGLSFFINLLGFLWFVYIIGWMLIIFKFVQKHPVLE